MVTHRPSIHIITVILRKYIRANAYFFEVSTVDIDIKLNVVGDRTQFTGFACARHSHVNQSIVLRRTRCVLQKVTA